MNFGDHIHDAKYRLIGQENTAWYKTTATDIAIVLREAGDYKLEIAPNNDDKDSRPVIISIHVHTPFFRSAVFYVLCGVVLFLTSLTVFFFIIRYRKKHFTRELNYLKMEHRAINALLNPHFVFNAINNIQGLIHKTRKQEAADYLATLSRLIRQNLENLQYNLVPLENELALVQRYIQLQNLRFGENVILNINGADEYVQEVQIPPLLVHTFVENAIVHGYRSQDKKFIIDISITRHGQYLHMVIADNGVGIRASADKPAAHHKTSMGISFSQKRLARLSDFYNLQQSITVKDLSAEGGSGTAVTIIFYAKLKELFDSKHLAVH